MIFSGAVITAHGIRQTADIDILVNSELFERLKKAGWSTISKENGTIMLRKGIYEIYDNLHVGCYKSDTETLLKNTEIIRGIPFMPLKELISFKQALARPKDLKDIELINNFLSLN